MQIESSKWKWNVFDVGDGWKRIERLPRAEMLRSMDYFNTLLILIWATQKCTHDSCSTSSNACAVMILCLNQVLVLERWIFLTLEIRFTPKKTHHSVRKKSVTNQKWDCVLLLECLRGSPTIHWESQIECMHIWERMSAYVIKATRKWLWHETWHVNRSNNNASAKKTPSLM